MALDGSKVPELLCENEGDEGDIGIAMPLAENTAEREKSRTSIVLDTSSSPPFVPLTCFGKTTRWP
jgi:hypothetical protein